MWHWDFAWRFLGLSVSVIGAVVVCGADSNSSQSHASPRELFSVVVDLQISSFFIGQRFEAVIITDSFWDGELEK